MGTYLKWHYSRKHIHQRMRSITWLFSPEHYPRAERTDIAEICLEPTRRASGSLGVRSVREVGTCQKILSQSVLELLFYFPYRFRVKITEKHIYDGR